MKKSILKYLGVATTLGMLSACQSMSGVSEPLSASSSAYTRLPKGDPKQLVQDAKYDLLYHSFAYQTTAHVGAMAVSESQAVKTCEETHDATYATLVQRAEQAGLDVSADDYVLDRQALKETYIRCVAQRFSRLPDVDNPPLAYWTNEPNARKQKLINAYYLAPLRLGVAGSYKPLQSITALPNAHYQMGQLSLMVNQPIYFDLKAGDVYLWADNLAMVNAMWLDRRLGDGWRNKWLRVSMNDGSLPADFVRDFWRTLIEAERHVFDGLDSEVFESVDKAVFLGSLKQYGDTFVVDDNVKTIVRQQSLGQESQAVREYFYDKMTAKYPMLIRSEQTSTEQDKPTFDSQTLMQLLFEQLKPATKQANERLSDVERQVLNERHLPPIQHDHKTPNEPFVYYGLDRFGRLIWVYHQHEKYLPLTDTPVPFSVLTKIEYGKSYHFDRLPKAFAIPNRDDSVDLLVYGSDLLGNLKDDDGVFLRSLGYYVAMALGVEMPEQVFDDELYELDGEPSDDAGDDATSENY